MIYLDNAATSYPKPESVYKRVEDILRNIGGNPGRASHALALEASRVIFQSREVLAKLLNIEDSSRLVFTKNATESVNLALKGLLKKGDHVVTSSFEHNSVVKTLKRLEKQGVRVSFVKGKNKGIIAAKDIDAAITKNTKLITIVHASNVIGTIEPIEEIGMVCRKKSIPFMIDAAQTVGAQDIDVEAMNIVILAGTGHKALFGPQGTGFLYLKQGIEPLPLIDGGTGEDGDNIELPDMLETGTMNTPGIGGLGAGIEFILKQGVKKIRKHEESLIGYLLKELKDTTGVSIIGAMDAKKRASLISFNIKGNSPQDVGVILDRRFSIMTRCGTHCAPDAHRASGTFPHGAVRVSPGYFNTEKDCEEFIRAIRIIARA